MLKTRFNLKYPMIKKLNSDSYCTSFRLSFYDNLDILYNAYNVEINIKDFIYQ
jgi:hypothetical protein